MITVNAFRARFSRMLANSKGRVNYLLGTEHGDIKDVLMRITVATAALGLVMPTFAGLIIKASIYQVILLAIFKYADVYHHGGDFSESGVFGVLAISLAVLKSVVEAVAPAFLPVLMVTSAWVSLKVTLALIDHGMVEKVNNLYSDKEINDGNIGIPARLQLAFRQVVSPARDVECSDILTFRI